MCSSTRQLELLRDSQRVSLNYVFLIRSRRIGNTLLVIFLVVIAQYFEIYLL